MVSNGFMFIFNNVILETIYNNYDIEVVAGDKYYKISDTTKVYSKGEWNYVDGIPTPNE